MLFSDQFPREQTTPAPDSEASTRVLPGGAPDEPSAPRRAKAPRFLPDGTAPSQSVFSTGDFVGRFMLIGKLGSGGLGVVHRAYDPELDRKVAIKLLRVDRLSAAENAAAARTRLLREAQAGAQISHPNVAQVYDVGLEGDQVFLAIEFIEGVTLRSWLRDQPRSLREVLDVFIQAARGLAAAHDKKLLHRDLKPDNIMVTLNTALACYLLADTR